MIANNFIYSNTRRGVLLIFVRPGPRLYRFSRWYKSFEYGFHHKLKVWMGGESCLDVSRTKNGPKPLRCSRSPAS